jgi:PAS domain S-box-containing protein
MPRHQRHRDPGIDQKSKADALNGEKVNTPQKGRIALNNKNAAKQILRQTMAEGRLLLEHELQELRLLQQISNHIIEEGNVGDLYHNILRSAMQLMHADCASIQLFTPESGELLLLASENFHPDSSKFWKYVNGGSTSTCGLALANNARAIIENIEHVQLDMDKGDYDAYKLSGMLAVQSTPLVSRTGKQVGMMSTHWKEPHKPSERELGLCDIVARQVADLIERKKAEEALRENETRLNIILEGIGEAFYALDREWRFLFASRAALKMWDKEVGEVVGHMFLECFPQAAGSMPYQVHQRVMSTGITERFESVSPVLNRRIEILIAPTPQGGLSVAFRDIEDAKQAEEALRASEEQNRNEAARLRSILKSISDAVYIGDASGITLANQPALDQLGYESYDDLNRHIGELSVEIQTRDAETNEIISPEQQAFARALAGEYVTQNVTIRKRKDGSERILRSAASPVEVDGKIIAAVAVNTDITEQWRTAAALHESEQKLKELNESLEQQVKDRTSELQQSHDSLQSILDTTLVQMSILEAVRNENNQIIDFEIKLVNKELEKETGRNDLVGKFYATEYPGIKQMGLFDLIVKTTETGEPQATEYFYTYEGFDKWFSSMFIKLNDGVVATNMDITDRKLAEEQVKNFAIRQKELEEKQQQEIFRAVLDTQEAERKRIAENLHNSLGQMLYAIKLGLGTVNKSQLAENAWESLKNVDKLLSEAINESRRLSHELMPTILEDFGLKAAVEDICRKLSDKVKIKCRFKGLAKKMEGHIETAVYRLVQELVMNIVKHSDAAEALVLVEIGKSAILISVQDNGKGFNVMKEKRAGIGLKTIRNSVNLLNGDIDIVSKPGEGTIINIEIPYKPNK